MRDRKQRVTSVGDVPDILLIGTAGQLGWELRRTLATLGRVTAPPRSALDLTRADVVRSAVRETGPALIVNAAAWTDVDGAESNPDAAIAVNAEAPALLAKLAVEAGALLVHFSTDYVFDGSTTKPYREADATAPLNVYGRSKLEGEKAVAAAGGPHLILRTSWLYGTRGRNFLLTMLRLARERDRLSVVDDQRGSPTWCRMVAESVAQMLATLRAGGGFRLETGQGGVYHVAAEGITSWYGFACEIVRLDPLSGQQRCREIVPIETSGFPRPAARPRFSALDCSRFAETFGLRMPHWSEQLRLALDSARNIPAAAVPASTTRSPTV